MNYRSTIIASVLLLLGLTYTPSVAQVTEHNPGESAPLSTGQILQQTVVVLADGIRSSVSGGEFSRIAVMPFTTLRGEENDLGLYISDKLTSELSVGEDNLQLVERSRINQALKEMQLGETGFLSEETIQKTGQALGADAVIVGTIVEIGSEVDINLRVFSVSTLKILGKASQLLQKNEVIESLLSKTTPLVDARGVQSGDRTEEIEESGGSLQNGEVFFKEDFSGIEEGLFPEGWIGGSTLAVKPSDSKRGANCLTNFRAAGRGEEHQFTIPNILFPENWKFEVECIHYHDPWCNAFVLKIGEVEFKFYRDYGFGYRTGGSILFNGIATNKAAPPVNQINLITIEKSGPVIWLYVNSEKIHVIRVENLDPPRGISFSTRLKVGFYRLEGTKLP